MIRHPWLKPASLAVLAVAVVALLWLAFVPSGPTGAEHKFVRLLAEKRWDLVYDLAPPEEFEGVTLSREHFVTMMRDLTEDLPVSYFAATIEEVPGAGPGAERGEHYVLLSFGNAPAKDGRPSQLLVRALQGREGWTIPCQELPIVVSKWHRGSPNAHWHRFLRAMRAADVKEYPVNMSGLRLHADRLSEYVEGRADYASVYSK
jgi:hypothetical protein